MDDETRADLRFKVRRKVSEYIVKSGLPLDRTASDEATVVCPNCGRAAIVKKIPIGDHFEFWKCNSCDEEGDAVKYAMKHLRVNDEDEALLDVCRKLGVSVPELVTIHAKELMKKEFLPLQELIEGMLAPGLYILAGAPKIGKSWLVLQIAHHISTGTPLWERKVMKHEVLYLSLEDTLPRIQRRLLTICDGETWEVSFATHADMLGNGFEKQLSSYLTRNTGTKVVIVDTLAKVRDIQPSSNVYASDYATMSTFKHMADTYKVAVILVHHTRKQEADDVMQTILGTNGLMGGADGAMVLEKPDRACAAAILCMTSRDFEDTRISLQQNKETMCWELAADEGEVIIEKTDPIHAAIRELISRHGPWRGTAQDLVDELKAIDFRLRIRPNALSRKLNDEQNVLKNDFGVYFARQRTAEGKYIILESFVDMCDASDT